MLLLDILICSFYIALGAAMAIALLSTWSLVDVLSLGLGLGAGLHALLLFLVSLAGLPLSSMTVAASLVLLFLLAVASAVWRVRRGRSRRLSVEYLRQATPGSYLVSGILVLLVAGAFILSVGMAYYDWDSVAIWAIKAYGIAKEGSVYAASHYGNTGSAFPLNIPLQIAVFRILDGDVLPGSKILFPLYFGSLLLFIIRFMRKRGMPLLPSALGALLLGTTPIFFHHATVGYVNLPTTWYLAVGGMILMDGVEGNDLGAVGLAGLLLMLGVWTRPEGIILWAALIAAVLLASSFKSHRGLRWIPVVAAPLLFLLPWFIFMQGTYVPQEEYEVSRLALQGLLRGDVRWTAFVTIARFLAGQVLRYRDFGWLLLLNGAVVLIGFRPGRLSSEWLYRTLFLATLFLGLAVVGIHYTFAYSPKGMEHVYTMLSNAFNRVSMPVVVTLTLLAMETISPLWKERMAA